MADLIQDINISAQTITVATTILHAAIPLLCLVTYIQWVQKQYDIKDSITAHMIRSYLALTIISSFTFFFLSSIFYMWAYRYPEPEEISKRRRLYGIIINFFLSDLPLFILHIVILTNIDTTPLLFVVTSGFVIISFGYSVLRVWSFFVVKLIKIQNGVDWAGNTGTIAPPSGVPLQALSSKNGLSNTFTTRNKFTS